MIFLTPYILETPQQASKITNEIITDGQKLSEAERILMQRNNEDYLKSTKQQGITREMLDPHGQLSGMGTSDDVKPREKATRK